MVRLYSNATGDPLDSEFDSWYSKKSGATFEDESDSDSADVAEQFAGHVNFF